MITASGESRRLDKGNASDHRPPGGSGVERTVDGEGKKIIPQTIAPTACGVPLPSGPGLGCRRWWRKAGAAQEGRQVCAAAAANRIEDKRGERRQEVSTRSPSTPCVATSNASRREVDDDEFTVCRSSQCLWAWGGMGLC